MSNFCSLISALGRLNAVFLSFSSRLNLPVVTLDEQAYSTQ